MNATITTHDSARLEALELVIKQGRDSFLAVGMALAQINRDRLYRAEYSTFEEYLDVRWKISKSHGYRLIAFAKDSETSPIGDTPKNEFQSRKTREKALAKQTTDETNNAAGDDDDSCAGLNGNSETGGDNLNSNALSEDQSEDVPHITQPLITDIAAKVEPNVTEYYAKLEAVMLDAIANATDKQLASMSVYAAMMPRLIKDEQRRRAK